MMKYLLSYTWGKKNLIVWVILLPVADWSAPKINTLILIIGKATCAVAHTDFNVL